jgi:hypothetical protein
MSANVGKIILGAALIFPAFAFSQTNQVSMVTNWVSVRSCD